MKFQNLYGLLLRQMRIQKKPFFVKHRGMVIPRGLIRVKLQEGVDLFLAFIEHLLPSIQQFVPAEEVVDFLQPLQG